jgi:hypothetical protein
MVNAARPVKHGGRVVVVDPEGSLSWVPYRVALSGLLSCCSEMQGGCVCVCVCGGPDAARPYKKKKRTSLDFCTPLCECLALFLVHPPGASQQNTLFQSNSRQMQTLHSIMTSGVHSNGVLPVAALGP